MSFLISIFLGLIQGLTEFLPVSSSGHLAFFQNVLGVNLESGNMLFDVLLHLGTLVSVIIYYRKDIWDILTHITKRRIVPLVIIATVPLLAAVFLNDYVDVLFQSIIFIGIAWLVTGILLILSDKLQFVGTRKTEATAKFSDALIVGIVQAIAIVPGLSRSGSTITAGLFRGLDRRFAVKFSFFMSIPAIIGANILEVKDALESGIEFNSLPVFAVGMVVAAVSGYFAIKLVNWLSERAKFTYFGIYCLLLGALSIVIGIVK